MIAPRESAVLAERLSRHLRQDGIHPGQLTLHADRGTSMKLNRWRLLADLGVTKTHSRHV